VIWALLIVLAVAIAVVAVTVWAARRFVHEQLASSPMHRYLLRDADPHHHGPGGTFEAHLTLRLFAPSPLIAQRQCEVIAGELLGLPRVYLAEVDTLARFDEDDERA